MASDKPVDADSLSVEVVYAEPGRQVLRQIEVSPGTTALEGIGLAELDREFPDLRLEALDIAVWGSSVDPGVVLRHGDRVEVLRPLQLDPRDARRALAEVGRVMGGR